MIALGITLTWLALTAADRASREPHELALTETWPAMPGVSPL
jgi:hypothetical protein